MTISEAQSVLHCPDAYGGIHGKKYGQALEVAFKSLEAWSEVRKCVTFHEFDKLSEEELTGFQGFILERLQEVEE